MTGDGLTGRAKRLARATLGDHAVRRTKARRLRLMERLPLVNPAPGLGGLDREIARRVASSPVRTFVEFGANDGLQQSNSYLLERDHGWRGVLIEPIPQLAAECVVNRPLATVVCGAVVHPAEAGTALAFVDRDLCSTRGPGPHRSVGITLSTLIDELLDGRVGLVSVDVEGAELDALAGLDLGRHLPAHIVVETARPAEVAALLGTGYTSPQPLSRGDFLFSRRPADA